MYTRRALRMGGVTVRRGGGFVAVALGWRMLALLALTLALQSQVTRSQGSQSLDEVAASGEGCASGDATSAAGCNTGRSCVSYNLSSTVTCPHDTLLESSFQTRDSSCITSRQGLNESLILPAPIILLVRNHVRFNLSTGRCDGNLGISAAQELISSLVRSAIRTFTWVNGLKVSISFSDSYLGVLLRDTCSSPLLTVKQLNDALQNPQYSISSKLEKLTQVFSRPQFVSGPSLSDEVAIVSPMLSARKIPHLSFRATSVVFEDTNQFPFSFRTVPSDRYQVQAIGDLLQHFGWTYIGVVASSDAYGLGGLDALRQEATNRSVCIGLEESFPAGEEHSSSVTHGIVQSFANDDQLAVLVIFALDNAARSFLACLLAKNISRRYTIVAGEDWISRVSLRSISPNFKGCGCGLSGCGGSPQLPPVVGFFPRSIGDKQLKVSVEVARSSQLLDQVGGDLPWIVPYIRSVAGCSLCSKSDVRCSSFLSLSNSAGCPGFIVKPINQSKAAALEPCRWPSSDEAMHLRPLLLLGNAVAKSVHEIFEVCSPTTYHAVDAARKVTLRCDPEEAQFFSAEDKMLLPDGTWQCRVFTKQQSAFPLYHLIHLDHRRPLGAELQVVGMWQGLQQSAGAGRLMISTLNTSLFAPSGCSRKCSAGQRVVKESLVGVCSVLCSSCQDCPLYYISNGTACRECPSSYSAGYVTVPNANRTQCVDGQRIFDTFDSWERVLVLSVSVLTALLPIFTLAMFWFFRDKQLIKTADVKLSAFILVGFTLGALSTILLLLRPTDTMCLLARLFSAPWLDFATAAVISKVSRISHIFSKDALRRGGNTSRFATLGFNISLVCLVVFIGWLVTIVFLCIDPPVAFTEVLNRTTMKVYCKVAKAESFTTGSYSMLLVVVSFVVAFRSRSVPEMYNESYHLFICSFGSLMLITGLSSVAYVGTARSVFPLLFAIAVDLQILMIWVCIFAVRLYYLLRMVLLKESESASQRSLGSTSAGRRPRSSLKMRLDNRASFHLRRMAIDDGRPKHTNLARPPEELCLQNESCTPRRSESDSSILTNMTCLSVSGDQLSVVKESSSCGVVFIGSDSSRIESSSIADSPDESPPEVFSNVLAETCLSIEIEAV